MKRKRNEMALRKRIQAGTVQRQDVARRLAELAFGEANDCVKLVLDQETDLDSLDLSLLSEVKRNGKGAVEVKLIDRLQVLQQLAALAGKETTGLSTLLDALQDGEGG